MPRKKIKKLETINVYLDRNELSEELFDQIESTIEKFNKKISKYSGKSVEFEGRESGKESKIVQTIIKDIFYSSDDELGYATLLIRDDHDKMYYVTSDEIKILE
jgi:biotin-(acetyl-CoA carboxylase) ligase